MKTAQVMYSFDQLEVATEEIRRPDVPVHAAVGDVAVVLEAIRESILAESEAHPQLVRGVEAAGATAGLAMIGSSLGR